MNNPETLPAPVVDLPPTPQNKWEREYRAFLRMLPDLLKENRDKYVAVHEEQVVDSDTEKIALAMRAYSRFGYVPIYIGLVTERPLLPIRMPSRRATGGK